ncbi:heme ABC transporter ATP-binding protein [Shimia sp. R11_0]|uniref:heme ABC transporter ATP-binding protein n=1 Tax=Shimia sp. R11_0 TaxID=2821096 RepID=UPI001AD96029|nr:heme ABC transporter ATP-binding protein [Shimia sp. R11_0]MBO9478065.1 heme ABC transporter ATP-binding protein [Shimia sp. R11_0]
MSLTADQINVFAGKTQLLQKLSFKAIPGQLTAIVGPSGAGKSTLLKALCGDITYHGSVHLNGRDISTEDAATLAEQRAVLAQATPLAFPFTVWEIVRLGLRGDANQTLIDQALHSVDMDGFSGHFYQSLSGGEQQRVQLARVLCQSWSATRDLGPRWLLLDEPVSSLDIGQQLRVMHIARQFTETGGGVVAVMHDLNLTAMFADSVALIANGRLVAQGTPQDTLTSEALSAIYGCTLQVGAAPTHGPFVLPQMASL